MSKPLITVGMPYTDQADLLAEAVASVIGQTFQDWELILYGDGPDARTKSVAESFTDARIRHVEVSQRSGLALALNAIAGLARADLLARMDGDDIMHPMRLERQYRAFQENPKLDVVGSRAYLIDEESALVGVFKEPPLPEIAADFLASNAFTHPTVMGRRSWFLANPYDESLLRGQDKELWLRTGTNSNFIKLEEKLLYYRVARNHSWRRQARNSAYDRKIIKTYAHLATGRLDLVRRLAKSYIKQWTVLLLTKAGRAGAIYENKFKTLLGEEYLEASEILKSVLTSVEALRPSPKILAVTVTYGNRLPLVERTVHSALEAGAAEVLIVNNGTPSGNTDKLVSLYAGDQRVSILHLSHNEGSATGFSAGLLAALKSDYDLFLLLDDDNVIVKGHVSALLELLVKIKHLSGIAGVSAVREINERHQLVASGSPSSLSYPPPGSFMYFDFVQKLKLAFPRARSRPNSLLEIPTAPYGGMLVDRFTVEAIGLPNEELGLYEDDTEWSSRISADGKVVLCPEVRIEDIDGKFSEEAEGSGPERLIKASDQYRVYFAVRNRVLWEKSQSSRFITKARYSINRAVYLTLLYTMSRRNEEKLAYQNICSAVKAGEANDLTSKFRLASTPSDSRREVD